MHPLSVGRISRYKKYLISQHFDQIAGQKRLIAGQNWIAGRNAPARGRGRRNKKKSLFALGAKRVGFVSLGGITNQSPLSLSVGQDLEK